MRELTILPPSLSQSILYTNYILSYILYMLSYILTILPPSLSQSIFQISSKRKSLFLLEFNSIYFFFFVTLEIEKSLLVVLVKNRLWSHLSLWQTSRFWKSCYYTVAPFPIHQYCNCWYISPNYCKLPEGVSWLIILLFQCLSLCPFKNKEKLNFKSKDRYKT